MWKLHTSGVCTRGSKLELLTHVLRMPKSLDQLKLINRVQLWKFAANGIYNNMIAELRVRRFSIQIIGRIQQAERNRQRERQNKIHSFRLP